VGETEAIWEARKGAFSGVSILQRLGRRRRGQHSGSDWGGRWGFGGFGGGLGGRKGDQIGFVLHFFLGRVRRCGFSDLRGFEALHLAQRALEGAAEEGNERRKLLSLKKERG
jgi:hypothetical protein